MTYDDIINQTLAALPPGANYDYLLLCTKNGTYAPLRYWLERQTDLSGETRSVYDGYAAWANEHSFEIISKHAFTKVLAKRHYYPIFTKIDGRPARVYRQLEQCPTCNQALN